MEWSIYVMCEIIYIRDIALLIKFINGSEEKLKSDMSSRELIVRCNYQLY